MAQTGHAPAPNVLPIRGFKDIIFIIIVKPVIPYRKICFFLKILSASGICFKEISLSLIQYIN